MMQTESPSPPAAAGGVARIDWQAVLTEHESWLRTIAAARLRDPHAVDEVMQEVAVAAVRQSAPLKDASKVAPWLYRLVVRQCLLYRRKMGRRRKLVDRFTEKVPPASHDTSVVNPLDWLLVNERRVAVRSALSEIAPRDAELLLLKYIEDWSYKEMAESLGVTVSTVEARLHRARGKLRTKLLAKEVIDSPT